MIWTTFLITLNLGILLTGGMLLVRAWPYLRVAGIRWMSLLIFSYCVVSFCAIMIYSSTDFATKVFFSHFRFVGYAGLAPSWFLFISAAFRRWNWSQKKSVLAVIFTPPIVTIILSLMPKGRDLVTTQFESFQYLGLSALRFKEGSWFPVHYLWSYLFVILATILGTVILFSTRGVQRRQIAILMMGGTLGALVDFLVVYSGTPLRWLMLTSSTYIVTEGAVFYAVFRHQLFDIAPVAMKKVFRKFPDPVLILDDKNCLREASDSSFELFGWNKSCIGCGLAEIFPEAPQENGFVAITDKTGLRRHFDMNFDPLKDESGFLVGTLIFMREITSLKNTQEKLSNDLEFKARLIAMIAHDMSGNLAGQMRIASDLEQKLDQSFKPLLVDLNAAVFDSQKLFSGLLTWLKAERSGFEPSIIPYEINFLVRDVIKAYQVQARSRGIRIQFQSSHASRLILGDSVMIESVLRNLLSNAIRASHGGKDILVELSSSDNRVYVSVKDFGVGMTADRLHKVIQASQEFFTSDVMDSDGYGIGLAIARRFVELHEGQLVIDSELGLGTTVSFDIPLEIKANHVSNSSGASFS